MAIKYKLVQRKDFSKDAPKDAKKYFAQIVSNGTVTFDELCEGIAEESALTSGDVKGMIDRLTKALVRHLKAGRIVQNGELGNFRPTLGSKGAASEKEFDAGTMMKKPGMMFTPGKALQNMRTQITFERISKKEETTTGGGEEERPGEL